MMMYGNRLHPIQTNGTLLDRPVLDLCSRTLTTLSVSLDGPAIVNDLHRRDLAGQSAFDRTLAGICLLQCHPDADRLFTGVLSVIDPKTDPGVVYRFLKDLGVPSMDFLYRDGNHDRLPPGKESFESVEYGPWLGRLWDLYISDPSPVPIRILDDVTRLILGGRGVKEGIGTTPYGIVVIDTDGSITRNDTLKSSFDRGDRFDSCWTVHHDDLSEIVCTEEFEAYSRMQLPTSPICQECRFLGVCGGGMPLFRWKSGNGYDNPSVYCHDHQHLIEHVAGRLSLANLCPPSLICPAPTIPHGPSLTSSPLMH